MRVIELNQSEYKNFITDYQYRSSMVKNIREYYVGDKFYLHIEGDGSSFAQIDKNGLTWVAPPREVAPKLTTDSSTIYSVELFIDCREDTSYDQDVSINLYTGEDIKQVSNITRLDHVGSLEGLSGDLGPISKAFSIFVTKYVDKKAVDTEHIIFSDGFIDSYNHALLKRGNTL